MTRRRPPGTGSALSAGLLALAVAGCGGGPATTTAPPVTTPATTPAAETGGETQAADVLAGRRTWGGLCAEGPCRTDLVVRADGSWTLETEAGSAAGVLDEQERAGLEEAVAGTGLADDVRPATACAADSDGTSVEYVWRVDGAPPVSASSCEQVVAADDPLVQRLEALAADVTP